MKTFGIMRGGPIWLAISAVMLMNCSSPASGTDDQVVSFAKDSYVFKHYLSNDPINTKCRNGVVTLTGAVAEMTASSLAQFTLEGIPGVKTVQNGLIVLGENPTEFSDAWIRCQVKTVLSFHHNLRKVEPRVIVRDGVVYLTGRATSLTQKSLFAQAAKEVNGVKYVVNAMQVSEAALAPDEDPREKIDDASVTAEIRSWWLSHDPTRAPNIKVETTDGTVRISGHAKSEKEKNEVTQSLSDINGVRAVINGMYVELAAPQKGVQPLPPKNLRIVSE